MDYIGASLKEKMTKDKLSIDQSLNIIKQIGTALDFVHREGIVHRDVKPANIFLKDDEKAFLGDFGCAKSTISTQDGQQLTAGGSFIGSHTFMAKEQVNAAEVATSKSDVYALAVTFFNMLVDDDCMMKYRPRYDETFIRDIGSVKRYGINQHPSPLPHLSSVFPDVCPCFDKILVKATDNDPNQRYETVQEFTKELFKVYKKHDASFIDAKLDFTYQCVDNGRLKIALEEIEKVLEVYPWYLKALELKGEICKETENWNKLFDTVEAIHESEPSCPKVVEYSLLLEQRLGVNYAR
jgi:serine/threonine protein kinase